MEQAPPPKVAGFSLDTSKLMKRRPVAATATATGLEARRTEGNSGEVKQYITALDARGVAAVHPTPSVARLVIPLPGTAALQQSTSDLEARAVQSLVDEAKFGPALTESTLVIPAAAESAAEASAAGGGYKRSRAGNDDLLNALFKPEQKRVRGDGSSAPLLLRGRPAEVVAARDDRTSYALDLAARAPDMNVHSTDVYDRVPIEEYGAAMLRGMGVAENQLQRALVAPGTEGSPAAGPEPRQGRQGLGAAANPLLALDRQEKGKRYIQPGEKRAKPVTLEEVVAAARGTGPAPIGADASTKSAQVAAIKSRKYPGIVDGAVVVVSSGRYMGKVAIVAQAEGVPGLEKCRVRLSFRGRVNAYGLEAWDAAAGTPVDVEEAASHVVKDEVGRLSYRGVLESDTGVVEVAKGGVRALLQADVSKEQAAEVAFLTAVESKERLEKRRLEREAAAAARAAEAAARASDAAAASAAREEQKQKELSERALSAAESRKQEANPALSFNANEQSNPQPSAWLIPATRVRVADERWLGGKYYKQKGVVHDVVSPGICTLHLSCEDGRVKVLDDVPQRVLETALPKAGGYVCILTGPHKKRVARLLDRDAASSKVRVQLHAEDGGTTLSLSMDDVAEHVPHASHG